MPALRVNCRERSHDRSAIYTYINAGVAQWQSSGIVNRRLQVRLLLPAPQNPCMKMLGFFVFPLRKGDLGLYQQVKERWEIKKLPQPVVFRLREQK